MMGECAEGVIRVREAWPAIPALPRASCVTSGRLLSLSEAGLPPL